MIVVVLTFGHRHQAGIRFPYIQFLHKQFFGPLAEQKYPYKFYTIPSMSLKLLDLDLISHTQRGIQSPEINLKPDF